MLQILLIIVRVFLALLVPVGAAMIFVSFGAVVVGLVRAASRRKPGVHFLVAFNSMNVLLAPQLYQDDARRWARIHLLGYLGMLVSLLVTAAAMFGLKLYE